MKKNEKEFKSFFQISIQEQDEKAPCGSIRLTYDLGDDFTTSQLDRLKSFINTINTRFPNIKVFYNTYISSDLSKNDSKG